MMNGQRDTDADALHGVGSGIGAEEEGIGNGALQRYANEAARSPESLIPAWTVSPQNYRAKDPTTPNSSAQTIYYQDGAIRITNTHATFHTHTYALTEIVSASTRILPSQLAPGVAVILTGSSVLVVGLYWYPLLLGPFGLLIAALGFAVMRRAHTSYAVRLWSTSGEVDVLVTQDQTYTQTIVGALTTAIHQQILTRLDSSDHGMPDSALAPPAH